MDILSSTIQDHQWNYLIRCKNIFTSQLFTNCNNFQQDSDLLTKTEQSTRPTKLYYSLCIHPQKKNPDTVRTRLPLLNLTPLIHHHHHHLCQRISLTTHSKPCFLNLTKYLRNNIKDLKNKKKNWSSWEKNNTKNQRILGLKWLIQN